LILKIGVQWKYGSDLASTIAFCPVFMGVCKGLVVGVRAVFPLAASQVFLVFLAQL